MPADKAKRSVITAGEDPEARVAAAPRSPFTTLAARAALLGTLATAPLLAGCSQTNAFPRTGNEASIKEGEEGGRERLAVVQKVAAYLATRMAEVRLMDDRDNEIAPLLNPGLRQLGTGIDLSVFKSPVVILFTGMRGPSSTRIRPSGIVVEFSREGIKVLDHDVMFPIKESFRVGEK